jgi:amino acid adenylation domain-containing protein
MEKLIYKLKQNKVKVNVVNNNLELSFPKDFAADEILNEVRKNKQELVEYIKKRNKGTSGFKEITLVGSQTHYALSHAQRRLWVLDQLVDTSGLYNVPIINSFKSLDLVSFNKALLGLLKRHEVLRTTIHMIDGEPRQIIHNVQDFNFNLIQQEATDVEIDEIKNRESFHPFDLTVSPIRASLISSSDGSYVFIFVLHHIMTDGWSMNVIGKDFLALYEHYCTGEDLKLPDLRFQYKDYSFWQHEQLRLGNLDKSRNFWLEKLSGELPSLNLPLDNKREGLKNYGGAEVSFEISPDQSKQLGELGNNYGASFFMVMVSLVKCLLFRYTDQKDIIVGTPVSGRDHPELENQVGFYSNTIVLRSVIGESDSFKEVLANVSNVMLDSYEHQYFPYDLLVDELNLDRDMNRNPLFDVMVSLDDSLDDAELNEQKYTEEIISSDDGVNKFDLTYSFSKLGNGSLNININYNTGLFKKSKILRMAGHLRNMALQILKDADQKISEIEYLSKEEKNQILHDFNGTAANYNLETSFKKLLELQVERTPSEISLISDELSLTFREMNSSANKMAHFLIEKCNVKKDDYVGIMMHEGIDRIITLLSIIKLGAVYIPIDPMYPEERKTFIINDTGLKTLITNDHHHAKGDYSLVNLMGDNTILDNYSDENPAVNVESEDIFTILYTSGSTGNPKGVLVKNKGLINRINWLWDKYDFCKDDVIYQKTPIVFDVSIGELFMPLCYGAKLLIAGSDSSQQVIENINKFNVTYIHFSPTLLNKFLELDTNDIKKISSLKYVFASGEELLKETVSRYYSKLEVPLINLYGPTEASIEVSVYETKSGDEVIPIGKPISNVNLYILDGNNKLLPIGVQGEIGIGGIGLAKGYLNQEEKTNDKFILDPYNTNKNQKIYKTGDIGSWNEKGEIEFFGRKDNQIRIGGSRIEPGEIESKILEHPDVQEVAVVVNEDSFKNSHLIAYYVKRENITELHQPIQEETLLESRYFPVDNVVTNNSFEIDFCIHELIEKKANEYPERIALLFEDKEVTYKMLNETANQLACLIRTNHQIGLGDLVGVIMDRSEKMIISILAILKSGAAYVPIDSDYPEQRINYIIKDSDVKFIIYDQNSKQKNITNSIQFLVYEDIEEGLNNESIIVPDHEGSINDLCYICYTSGSTGNPKGVMVEHRSVADYVMTFNNYFQINIEDIVIQQSSISFDTSIEEIFPILSSGGKLLILPKGGRDIDAIIESINLKEVTILSTTPLVINELNIRFSDLKRCPRVIISGGDELRPTYIDKIVDSTKLYNTYGPTETTVCASFALIDKNTKCNVIGTPIANHKIYLLNDNMERLAIGEIGEIHIEGSGVARGYINKKNETDKHFINNPFDGGILYKTGDLGRWNNNGLLEFCGRKDNQVKIRGYRVEPTEVDEVLKQYEGIINCFTTSKIDLEFNKHLITYFTSSDRLDVEQLRTFLNNQLPHYMVPGNFVQVDEFPRTINGKINANELPIPYLFTLDKKLNLELRDFLKNKLPIGMVPSHFRNLDKLPITATGKVDRKVLERKGFQLNERQTQVIPKNEVEKKLLGIWERCLNQSGISTENNFFEVGGNSLKATQIVASVFRELQSNLTLKDIFNNPTIIELSRIILNQNKENGLIVKLNKIDSKKDDVFFIPPIIGSSTVFRNIAIKLNTNYNVYGLQYKGFDYETSFDDSIEEMAKTFIGEIKKITKSKSISLIGYSMGVPIAFEMAKILENEDYNLKLIFIDRGVYDQSESEELSKERVNELLEMELKHWIKEVKESDAGRIRDLIFNSSQILNNYQVTGKISSGIFAIEASKNYSKANMNNWRKYAEGNFEHCYIDSDHYGILNTEHSSTLVELIIKGCSKHIVTEMNYENQPI